MRASPIDKSDAPARFVADTWSALAAVLLFIGVAIRFAMYFPLAMFQIDSDATLSGLCAFRVAAGTYPVFFPGGTRLSAASCYVAAGYFHLFGTGRVGLALTGLTWGVLYLIFSFLFLRALLGPKIVCLAFLFAIIPSEQFMTVTYAPWAYGEIMASCAATLYLAAMWRGRSAMWNQLFFGLSVGLGIWFSLETLMVALPAVAWVALGRRQSFLRETPLVALGSILGSAPFLYWNLTHGFPTLTQNWASRPAPGIMQAFQNLIWLLTYMLPKLLFRSSGFWSETGLLMMAYAIASVGFIFTILRNRKADASPYGPREIASLLLLVVVACSFIFSASQAGTGRGWTVRYIAPLYVAVPLFLGLGIEGIWRWSKVLSVLVVAALLIPNLLLYGLPGSRLRTELTSDLSNEMRICRLLADQHVQMVYGDYFWVYHLNFDTQERILGIPSVTVVDYYDYAKRLGAAQVRWALLGGLDEVKRLANRAHVRGSLVSDGDLWLFISDRAAPNAKSLITRLRKG